MAQPKFIWTLQGGEWAQEASAGTKALVPPRVQAKQGSLLWVPLWSPKLSTRFQCPEASPLSQRPTHDILPY